MATNSPDSDKPKDAEDQGKTLLKLKERRDRLYATIKQIWDLEHASKDLRRRNR